ncbi:hypothetical protein PsorP6_013347 [Peronosclerospora sorghi]|uniref:Uncharacterized protein n=1 Tax=Peronosclerospora sorghi TaxID=230839 RepID=A0ACC0WEI9_9STRA|nr:hypothetical protein PsorP6_013347 [Peronosclerospora sorghi]
MLPLPTARRVVRAARPATVRSLLRPSRPVMHTVSSRVRFLSDKPSEGENRTTASRHADASKLFASSTHESESDSDSDSSASDSEDEASELDDDDDEADEVEVLPIDEDGISMEERRRRLRVFLEHNAEYFDEERWGAQDGDAWFGFDGDLDAVTEEGVPTWLQSVRNMIRVVEERAVRAKTARQVFHKAKSTIVRVQELDADGRAYGTGRRKTSVARVWIKPAAEPFTGRIKVNHKDLVDYFVRDTHREEVLKPFSVVEQIGGFDVYCTVKGGGLTGQAGAVRHGLSRALEKFDPAMRPALKKAGFMTRDPRMVERKKPGQPKARKKFQWVKR